MFTLRCKILPPLGLHLISRQAGEFTVPLRCFELP